MNLDALYEYSSRQALELAGGVIGSLNKSGSVTPNVLVLVELDVMLTSDNGLAVESHTLCSLLKSEAGELPKGTKITASGKTYSVNSKQADDGFVIKVSVRDSAA